MSHPVAPHAHSGCAGLGTRGGAALGGLAGLLWGALAAGAMIHRNGLGGHTVDSAVVLLGCLALYGAVGTTLGAVTGAACRTLPGRLGRSLPVSAGCVAGVAAGALLWGLRSDTDSLPGRMAPLASRFPEGPLLLAGGTLIATVLAAGLARGGPLGRVVGRLRDVRTSALFGIGGILVALMLIAASLNLLGDTAGEEETSSGAALPREDGARIVLLGIDGATWRIMRPLMARGELPHFRRLVAEGTAGPLETTRPTLSPILWTSIATGVAPQRHGISGFTSFMVPCLGSPLADFRLAPGLAPLLRAGGLHAIPTTSDQRRAKAFWNICSEQGISVGVVGWWSTWPVEEVRGFMLSDRILRRISEYGGSLSGVVHPETLLREVEPFIRSPEEVTEEEMGALVRLRPAEMRALLDGGGDALDSLPHQALQTLRVVYNSDLMKSALGLHLYATRRPEVFALYLSGIDAVEHGFFAWWDPSSFRKVRRSDLERFAVTVPAYYAFIDRVLGDLLARIDARTVVCVLSDHGQVPAPGGTTRSPMRQGVHDAAPDGILVLAGPGIRKGVWIEGATIYDIVPTMLHLLGLPVGEDMEGRPLLQAMRGEGPGGRTVRFIESYTPKDFHARARARESAADEEIRARLRALGYIR